jgi:hypothetical protein
MQRKEKIRGGAAGAAGAARGGEAGPEVALVTFGLFLLPRGRPGRRLTGASEEVSAALETLGLFLLPRGRPLPRGAAGDPRFRREPPASAMSATEKTSPKSEMEEEEDAAEEKFN